MRDTGTILDATRGDPDEPRTLFAWLVALSGRLNLMDDLAKQVAVLAGTEGEANWLAVARICDGLDVGEITGEVKRTFDALGLMQAALRTALAEWESRPDAGN